MVDKFFTMDGPRFTPGLTDGLSTLYNQAGTIISSGTMTEFGSTGRYFKMFSTSTAGSYLIIGDFTNSYNAGNAPTATQLSEGFHVTATAAVPDNITSLSTTYLHVKYRLDDLEPNIGTGSANIISEAISGANFEARQLTDFTSTNTNLTYPVADLAAAQVVSTMLGRDDMTVSNKREVMYTRLREQGLQKLKNLGTNVRPNMTNT